MPDTSAGRASIVVVAVQAEVAGAVEAGLVVEEAAVRTPLPSVGSVSAAEPLPHQQ